MADIRINALANTATSAASDDYLALDGSANGTRKILATNIANNVTDVILGSSGPSVKSTLSARAPRQGLVFDGTAGVSVSTPALGTTDFSISFFVRRDSSAVQQYLVGNDNVGCLYVGFRTTGALYSGKTAGSANSDLNIGNVVGKWQHIVLVRSGGNITGYADGVSVGSVTDVGSNYTTGAYSLFQASTGAAALFGAAMSPYIYNRAISASEVVALYEAGAPSGVDYPTQVAGTALVTGDNSTFASNTGFWDLAGSSIGSGKATIPSASYIGKGSLFKKGYRYRVSVNVLAVSGTVALGDSAVALASWTTTGVKTVDVTATANYFNIGTAAGNTAEIDDVTVVPLGLLLAPDAAQAGGGLTWYDTSGNAANITLPASGVSWNVPFAGYLTAPVSSDLTLAGGNSGSSLTLKKGTSLKAGLNIAAPTGYANTVFHINDTSGSTSSGIKLTNTTTGTTNDDGFDLTVSGSNALLIQRENAYMAFYTNATETMRLFANGNLFIGASPVDSSNGKLQLATHTTSAGGIGFGTDTSLFRTSAGVLGLSGAVNAAIELYGSAAGIKAITMFEAGTIAAQVSCVSGSFQLKTGSSPTTALTLDSSQRAQFAGTTDSSSSTTGALTVAGGVGIAKKLYVGTSIAQGSEGIASGVSPIYAASVANATTVDVLYAGASARGALLRTYHDGGGTIRWQFGRYTASFDNWMQLEGYSATTSVLTLAGGLVLQGGTASTPASASAAGTAGTIQWDANYIYICTATNTWKRAAIATW